MDSFPIEIFLEFCNTPVVGFNIETSGVNDPIIIIIAIIKTPKAGAAISLFFTGINGLSFI